MILVAIKRKTAPYRPLISADDCASVDAVRRRLTAAADPDPDAQGAVTVGDRRLDPAVLACMRSNAETCRRFEL